MHKLSLNLQATNTSNNTLNATHYSISYSSSTSEFISQRLIINDSVCDVCGICVTKYIIDLLLSFEDPCQSVNINISAINAYGEGPPLQRTVSGMLCQGLIKLP